MRPLANITFNYTKLHREVTELHRGKKLDLSGPLWTSVDLSVSFLFSYIVEHKVNDL